MPPPPGPPVRLAILNDYPIIVHGLTGMLATFGARVQVVELASSLAPVSDVDVVLFDAFASAVSDEELRRLCASSRVVLYTWALDPVARAWAEAVGAAAVLSKALGVVDVLAAVEAVHGGRAWADPPTAPANEAQQLGDWPGRAHGLSPREGEILALIGQGLTNDEIARRCFLSINSVKTYIRGAYRKIGVTRRSQAVLWFVEQGYAREVYRAVLTDSWAGRPRDPG